MKCPKCFKELIAWSYEGEYKGLCCQYCYLCWHSKSIIDKFNSAQEEFEKKILTENDFPLDAAILE